jgi:hypothetical protein
MTKVGMEVAGAPTVARIPRPGALGFYAWRPQTTGGRPRIPYTGRMATVFQVE